MRPLLALLAHVGHDLSVGVPSEVAKPSVLDSRTQPAEDEDDDDHGTKTSERYRRRPCEFSDEGGDADEQHAKALDSSQPARLCRGQAVLVVDLSARPPSCDAWMLRVRRRA
jgi:hypothetical protein